MGLAGMQGSEWLLRQTRESPAVSLRAFRGRSSLLSPCNVLVSLPPATHLAARAKVAVMAVSTVGTALRPMEPEAGLTVSSAMGSGSCGQARWHRLHLRCVLASFWWLLCRSSLLRVHITSITMEAVSLGLPERSLLDLTVLTAKIALNERVLHTAGQARMHGLDFLHRITSRARVLIIAAGTALARRALRMERQRRWLQELLAAAQPSLSVELMESSSNVENPLSSSSSMSAQETMELADEVLVRAHPQTSSTGRPLTSWMLTGASAVSEACAMAK